MEKPPADPAEHAREFAQTWADKLEEHCTLRMQELGIPDNMNGEPDYGGDGRWHCFDPQSQQAGTNTTGVVLDSGVLNPDQLKGMKGGRIWPGMRLRDRSGAFLSTSQNFGFPLESFLRQPVDGLRAVRE